MPELALLLWLAYGVITLGLRVVLQVRNTGQTGLVGTQARPGSVEWFGETGHIVAFVLGPAAPILQINGVVDPIAALDGFAWSLFGLWLFVAALAGVTLSQTAMGASWRIGTDREERTELITDGPFAIVRNPIYSCMLVAMLGLALLNPNVLALASVAILVISLEIQTRMVEEPHMGRVHGDEYWDYAARAGRFLPGLGRLEHRHRAGPATPGPA